MTDSQRSMFGGTAPESKRKAKVLPKREPLAPAVAKPATKLSPSDIVLRDRNLAALRHQRAKAAIGDTRISEYDCPRCLGQRIEELIDIRPEGGHTWGIRCLNCRQFE